MIHVKDLNRRFRDREVVRGISFKVEPGQTVGFLGPNGAGKTTTIRILTGLLVPTSGQVTLDGIDVCRHPRQVQRRVGYLPDHPPLYHDMRVREYLEFVARLKGVAAAELADRVQEVMVETDVHLVSERLIARLSRGFRQRVGLAQALVARPPVLILDEPTTGLDPLQARRTREFLRTLKGRATILFSSHNLAEVEHIADRVMILDRGTLVVDASTHELVHASGHRRFRIVLGGADEARRDVCRVLRDVEGVYAAEEVRGLGPGAYLVTGTSQLLPVGILDAIRQHQLDLVEISPWPRPGLERAFFQHVGEEVAA